MQNIRIDLASNTATKPTAAMREFMCKAEVGDEQRKEDPSVNRLVEMVCELLGKEDAIFLPSGTMCNEIAFRVHCRPGDEIIMDKTSHAWLFETGGAAALSGALIYTLDGNRGIFTPEQVKKAIRPKTNHAPRSRVVSIEQTSNVGGGAVWPLQTINEVYAVADELGLAKHMDGARLLNAVVASGVSAESFAKNTDSVWIDFSKGLGAPVGAALAGSKEFIAEAWRWKHQFGGAMRQAGIIAAAGIYALRHHVDRLADDHENAQVLARGLADIEGIKVEPVETNLVFIDLSELNISSLTFNRMLMENGVRLNWVDEFRLRAATHLDISQSQIQEALQVIRDGIRQIAC